MSDPGVTGFVVPEAAEALARLGMPMEEAMRTQRAVRRLHPEPVSHEVLLPLLELSLKAPTSSNTQDWSYLVVEDREQKARIGRLYGKLYRVFNPIVERMAKGDEAELRGMRPGQWQAEHFDELPVLVIPCYRRGIKHKPVGRPQISVASFYGSVFPAVQNLLLG
ncbi:MAG TPA: nitroreductase family protein, partial [Acidimicrobiales bacterium]